MSAETQRIEALREKLRRHIEYEGLKATEEFRLGELNGIPEYSDITVDDIVTLLAEYDRLRTDAGH